jgi:sterol-4alpha-carboxylate 3-dehydrogenase (decarboxylating)
MAENLVLSANTHDFSTCALRSAPIFGPNDTACIIPTIHSCIAAGQTPFILGSGTNLQDFVFVTNVADAHVLACANLLNSQTAAGQAIFITNGEPVTARDLCIAIWKCFGHVPKFQISVPEGIAWCRDRYVSLKQAEMVLGYKPRVGLEEGIKTSCLVSV